jgi:N,N'-diacetyllegionaminate synthase
MDKVFIIAEAGVNHNGSLDMAMQLVDLAKDAGADAVKFQTFQTQLSIAQHAPRAEYQIANTGNDDSQYEMVRKLELSYDQFKLLKKHCENSGIEFMSTPFDLPSVDFLASIGMEIFKIASGEITNLPLLRKIGSLGRSVILSTGMSHISEVLAAVNVLRKAGTASANITLLHCTTEYPAPFEEVNLNAMLSLRQESQLKVGYSDHTMGIEVSIAACALGACIIEKHFTLDKNLPGPDHKASLDPSELRSMIRAIRNIEKCLGSGIKQPSRSEEKNLKIARKSIVASKPIKAGEVFSEENLATKRPGTGITPMDWDSVVGQKAKIDFNVDDLIRL